VESADPHQKVWEQEQEAQEPLRGVPVRLGHIMLLVLTLAAVFLLAGYLSAPKIEKLWLRKSNAASPVTATTKVVSASVTPGMPFDALRKLAETGDVRAQWIIGTRYHNGEGVPQDDAQAMRWFERAADQGYVDAQATAGAYYWAGRGVPKDLTRSYFWSTVALRQGDSSMESRLRGLVLQMTSAQVAAAQQQADDWLDHHPATSAAD
jgi:TPR repeat protein